MFLKRNKMFFKQKKDVKTEMTKELFHPKIQCVAKEKEKKVSIIHIMMVINTLSRLNIPKRKKESIIKDIN